MSVFAAERRQITPNVLSIPPGFENYFSYGTGRLRVIGSRNLLPKIQNIELGTYITTLEMWQVESKNPDTLQYKIFIKDFHDKKAVVDLALNKKGVAVIGGTGVYPTTDGESPDEYGREHSLSLKLAMDYKTDMAGLTEHFGLKGMKATVAMEPGQTGLSDWEESRFLQMATAWVITTTFKRAITGTDARQTDDTIGDMAIGSALGKPERVTNQICGTRKNFDTPGACRYSLEATLDVLHQQSLTPNFEGSVVSIQGFGRIGHAAVQLALDRGTKHIFLSEVKLPVNQEGQIQPQDEELYQDILKLQNKYTGRVTVVNDIYSQEADIFMPCSSQEGQLNETTLNKLQQAGVKVILAGANNILEEKNKWQLAKLAYHLDIVMPPEVLSNCGSVTMAGMERVYHLSRKLYYTYWKLPEEKAEIKFRDEVVVPFIGNNAKKRIEELLQIAKDLGTDIYTAGEIWYLRQQGKEAKVDENGILISST